MRLEAIEVPAGWTSRHTASGRMLEAPDRGACVRIVGRIRPLRHPLAIAASVVGAGAATWPPRTLETREGELALRWSDRAGDATRELGLIVADDAATLFAGVAASGVTLAGLVVDNAPTVFAGAAAAGAPSLADLVDELVRGHRLFLGVRRRRFWFEPPTGWTGVSVDGFDAHYLAPGHPRRLGCLTVCAAVPATAPLAAWWAEGALPGAVFSSTPIADHDLVGPAGLAGRSVQLRGRTGDRELAAELACLADRDYWYPLAVLADAHAFAELREVLAGVIASIRPHTSRGPGRAAATALGHWFR